MYACCYQTNYIWLNDLDKAKGFEYVNMYNRFFGVYVMENIAKIKKNYSQKLPGSQQNKINKILFLHYTYDYYPLCKPRSE